MTFREACEYATRIGIAEETRDGTNVNLILRNDEMLIFASQYEEDYSEVTPGAGIQPPVVTLIGATASVTARRLRREIAERDMELRRVLTVE